MRFLKKHTWILYAFFAIVLFPQSLTVQSKLDGRMIISGIAVDKEGSHYVVTAQCISINSGAKADGESAGMDFFTVNAPTVRDGILEIATRSGKEPGLAHLNYLVLGSSLFDEEMTGVIDFVLRDPHLDSAILVLVAENAEAEIKQTKEMELSTAISLRKTFVDKQEASNGVLIVANEFISNKYNPSKSAAVSFLEIERENEPSNIAGSEKVGGSEETGDSGSSNSSSGNSSSSSSDSTSSNGSSNTTGTSSSSDGSGSQELKKQGRLKYLSPIALFSDGLYRGKLNTEKDIMGFNFANIHSKSVIYGFTDIEDKQLGKAKITLHSKEKSSKIRCKLKNGVPTLFVDIKLSKNALLEIISEKQEEQNLFKTQKSYLSKEVRKQISDQIRDCVISAFNTSKQMGVDLFNSCNTFEEYNFKKYKEYFKTHTFEQYLNELQIEVDVKVSNFTG